MELLLKENESLQEQISELIREKEALRKKVIKLQGQPPAEKDLQIEIYLEFLRK